MSRLSIALLACSLFYSSTLSAGTAYYENIFGVAKTSNITYGAGAINNGSGSTNLRLDLWRPTDIGQGAVPTNTPALVLIHGGGFTSGSKNDFADVGPLFASLGYVVVSIDYRLAGSNPPLEPGPAANLIAPPPPYSTLPVPSGINAVNAAVNDATKAMQWMRNNAATYGVDPERIGIGGASAGAVTSLLQAYNNPADAVTPKVVLSYLGSMYGSQNSIQPGDAPAFIVGGLLDTTVPPSGSTDVATRMNNIGVYNELYMQVGVGHTVDFFQMFGGKTLLEHNINFLATYLVPEPSSLVLGAIGIVALGLFARKQRRK